MIKRDIFNSLKEHLDSKEISLIVGPRQSGKTTLMLMLKEYLQKSGAKIIFLNLDFESDKKFFASQRELINKIKLEIGESKGYIFIDEIQRKEDAGLFLKGLYDMNLPYKFIVSGSGSLELKEKIHESLVGRKRIFELSTITLREFLNYKTDYRYEDKLFDFFEVDKDIASELFSEYMNFGGYPRVVLESKLLEKTKIMYDIYHSYIEKDISYLLRVEKTEVFSSLIKVMASQTGSLVNYSELSSTLGVSLQTIKNYLWYAQKTFILQKITPYFTNIRKEITKSPNFYFHDIGLRNYTLGSFGSLNISKELGFVFQNLILNLIKDKFIYNASKIHFWRTKDKAEVDFVVEKGKELIPVEAKFKNLKKPELQRSFKNFIAKYKPKQAWIVNLDYENRMKEGQTDIIFLPYYKLL